MSRFSVIKTEPLGSHSGLVSGLNEFVGLNSDIPAIFSHNNSLCMGDGKAFSTLPLVRSLAGPISSPCTNSFVTVARFPFNAFDLANTRLEIYAMLELLGSSPFGSWAFELQIVDADLPRSSPGSVTIGQDFPPVGQRSYILNVSYGISGDGQALSMALALPNVNFPATGADVQGRQTTVLGLVGLDVSKKKDLLLSVQGASLVNTVNVNNFTVTKFNATNSDASNMLDAFGDSLTFGTGATASGNDDFLSVVGRTMSRAVRNRGIGGQTIAQISERVLRDVQTSRPYTLYVEMGRNDVGSTSLVASWVNAAENIFAVHPRVIFGVVQSSATETIGTANRNQIETLNSRIRDLYPNNVFDNQAALATNAGEIPAGSYSDGLHLSPAGQAIKAAALVALLTAKGW